MFQNFTIAGRLVRDNELKYAGANQDFAILNNTIACSEKNSKGEERTLFMPFNLFGKRAEALNKYLFKGDPVLLQGKIVEQKWVDKQTGEPKSRIVMEVSDFAFIGSKRQEQGQNFQHADPSCPF